MALYFYRALSRDGKKIKGVLDAASEEHVRSDLVTKKLYPIEITLHKNTQRISFLTSLFQRPVPIKDLIFFTKQLAILLKSGIPLVQSLELLSDQFSGKLKRIIISLKDDVKDGKSFADGLANFPETFSNIYIQLIKAGEATGKLEIILERLTEYLERQDEVSKRISKALSYPLFQLGIIGVVVVSIMIFVIPNIQKMLTSFGNKELPAATQFLIASSHIIINHYMTILIVVTIFAIVFEYWRSTPSGKQTIDKVTLKLPVIKYFSQTSAIVQFCRTLGMLIESGVNLSQALDIVCDIIDNSILVETLKQAKDKIIKQGKITPFLKETGLFPPMAIYLINTGEQSGNLDFMLLTVAKNYETELTDLTDSLTSKLDPLMVLVMGGVVGFIMWAVMGPIISMYSMAGI